MFEQAGEHFGGVDILVNNAGIRRDVPFHKILTARQSYQNPPPVITRYTPSRVAVSPVLASALSPTGAACRAAGISMSPPEISESNPLARFGLNHLYSMTCGTLVKLRGNAVPVNISGYAVAVAPEPTRLAETALKRSPTAYMSR